MKISKIAYVMAISRIYLFSVPPFVESGAVGCSSHIQDCDATVRIQYIFKPLCDLDNKKAWLGNMFMPSIIAKYRVEEYVLFDINCAQSFEHLKGLI